MIATVLSVRAACSGGDLLDQVEASRDLHGSPRLTILIHGYNDTWCAADAAYGDFERFPEVADPAVAAALGDLCEFYWPGDARGLGAVSFPLEIRRAVDSAAKLGAFLRELSRGRTSPLEIRIVCHSLGNRVGLELLKDYLAHGRPPELRFAGALLMAAAVQVSMVENATELHDAAAALGWSRVLFSEADQVLHWAFQTGELLAGEGSGVAVGRFGEPTSGLWSARANMSAYQYGHGSYWVDTRTGGQVRAWLGFAVPRMLDANALPTQRLPEAQGPGTRTLPTRAVGASASACGCPPRG